MSAGDLVFYVSFNIVLVISTRCRGDKERCSEAPYSNGFRSTLMRFYKRPDDRWLTLPTSDPFGDNSLDLLKTIFAISLSSSAFTMIVVKI